MLGQTIAIHVAPITIHLAAILAVTIVPKGATLQQLLVIVKRGADCAMLLQTCRSESLLLFR
ncbi:MAG: hypothetical protein JSR76_01160 [Verrucomicrobia bacterium]|nr:hypothetical protein [Verrucomicrobiota bacterium]